MPKTVKFSSGSLIYFQGDPADKIYILQTGKVSLVYQDLDTGSDIRDPVKSGEFFGVKSALGRYPREENAVALSETTAMVFTVPEFEAMAMANTRIVMKMLKVFSNQMRRVHRMVSKVMSKEEVSPSDGLFNVGEFYLKNQRYSHARHVFDRYLTFYPDGKNADQAAKNLKAAEAALARSGTGYAPSVSVKKLSSQEQYNEAVSMVSRGKYQEACISFKSIIDSGADPQWTAKASFEIGRCLFSMNKHEECLIYLTNMLTKFPRHSELTETMFIIGQCNEKIGRKDQAAAFYKKVISMGADNGITKKAKTALNAMGE